MRDFVSQLLRDIQRCPGGTFVVGGGLVIPCVYKLYGDESRKVAVRSQLAQATFDSNDVQ